MANSKKRRMLSEYYPDVPAVSFLEDALTRTVAWGIGTDQWARHLFGEHSQPYRTHSSSVDGSEESIAQRGGWSAGERAWSQLPGWVKFPPTPPGVGTSPELFLEFGPGRTAQGNLLVG
jgi:hypothetical protein